MSLPRCSAPQALARVLRAVPLRGLGLAAAASAAGELAALALMATATWLIVRAAAHPPLAVLGLAIVGVRGFALSRGTCRYVERLSSHDAALRALAVLRERVYAAVEPLGPAGLAALRGGDALSRLVADVDAVQDLLIRCLLPAAVALAVATAAGTLTAVLMPAAGAVLAAGLLLATVAVPAMTWWLTRRGTAGAAQARAELATRTLDLIDGAAELAAYGAAPAALGAAGSAARRLARLQRAGVAIESAATAAILAVQAATTLGVTVLAAAAIGHGLAPVWAPVLALTALAAFDAAMPLPAGALRLIEVIAAARRLSELFDAPHGLVEAAHPPRLGPELCTVELRDVRVRYTPDRPPALDGVDLRLEPGRRVALVGPSGSGKSTVLAALARFVDIEAGTYTINGHDARTLAAVDIRAAMTGVTQDAYVFHASVRDNLTLARPGATDAQLAAATGQARLLDWLTGLPDGLGTVVGGDGASMSGGQRQRLVLARALLADPQILLLDEPVEGLDPPTAAAVLAETLAATKGRTTLLVTHQLAGLDAVDEIIVLESGRVAQRGRHADLIAIPGTYRELWQAELSQVGRQ